MRERRDELARSQFGCREHLLSENDSFAAAGQVNSDTRCISRVTELATRLPRDSLARKPRRPGWIGRETCSPLNVDERVVVQRIRCCLAALSCEEIGAAHRGHLVALE